MLGVQYPEIPRGAPLAVSRRAESIRWGESAIRATRAGRNAPQLPNWQGRWVGLFGGPRGPKAAGTENRLPQIKADPRFEGTVGGFSTTGIDPMGRKCNPSGQGGSKRAPSVQNSLGAGWDFWVYGGVPRLIERQIGFPRSRPIPDLRAPLAV